MCRRDELRYDMVTNHMTIQVDVFGTLVENRVAGNMNRSFVATDQGNERSD